MLNKKKFGKRLAFTETLPEVNTRIVTNCIVDAADPELAERNKLSTNAQTFRALWDTGATVSAISPDVIKKFGLRKSAEFEEIAGSKGVEKNAAGYMVNIQLPNDLVLFVKVRSYTKPIPDFDVIIGMDIISQGDFAICFTTDSRKVSFRSPSTAPVDFCYEHPVPPSFHSRIEKFRHVLHVIKTKRGKNSEENHTYEEN